MNHYVLIRTSRMRYRQKTDYLDINNIIFFIIIN